MIRSALRFRVQGAGLTHRGRVRSHNEDVYLAGTVHAVEVMEQAESFAHDAASGWVLAVADGIGGNKAGERASREAAGLLAGRKDYTPEMVTSMLQYAHQRLFHIGATTPEHAGLGTTIAGLACGSEGLFAFSVGDSRVYVQQDGFLSQTTKDDNIAEALDAAGEDIPPNSNPRLLRALTQCLGGRFPERAVHPHIIPLRTRGPVRVLLCTDGLSECLSLDELEAHLPPDRPAPAAAEALLQTALQRGARDNVTLIVADLEPEGAPS